MIIHRSPYPDLVLPPKEVSLPEFIFHPLQDPSSSSSSRLTEKIYHPPPSHETYNAKPLRPKAPSHSLTTLKNLSNHFALHLLSHSFVKGDILSLVTTNQHDLTAIVLGANSIGVIVALHNPGYGKDELKGQMEMVKTKGILASKLVWEKTRDAGKGARIEGERIWTFEEPEEGGESSSSWLAGKDLEALLQAPSQQDLQSLQEHTSKIDGTHDAVYCFSSGTSGKPKAVRLTQANLIANVIQSTVLMSDRFDEPLFDRWDAAEKSGWYDDVDLQGKANDSAKGTAGKLKELGHALKSKLKLGEKSGQAERATSDDAADARPKECHIDLLPQFHCYGLVVAFVALHTATPRVVLPRFDLQLFLHLVQERKATFAFVVPPIIQAILKSANQIKRAPRRSSKARSLQEGQDTESKKELFDISSLTRLSSGATSLPTTLRRRMYEKFGISCTDGYGMSEMSPIISLQTFQDLKVVDGTLTSQSKMDTSTEEASTSSSVGRLAPSTLARIIAIPDEESDSTSQGEDLPADKPGELWLYGPQQMAGYLNNDSANSSTFVISSTDKRRWLRTGDIVSLDSSTGHLRIHGRTKDVIKVNGFQVSPSEVEEIVLQCAGEKVGDVAVVGVKIPIKKDEMKRESPSSSSSSEDEQEEEVPWAFVVPSSGSAEQQDESASKELLDLINPQLTRYKRLRGVTWVDSLPRSEAGKVLKRELRDDFQKKRAAGAGSK